MPEGRYFFYRGTLGYNSFSLPNNFFVIYYTDMEPIQYNQVTWYSKALALIVFVLLLALTFYFGFEFGKTKTETDGYKRISSALDINRTDKKEPLGSVLKPGWKVFSSRLYPFQFQYPEDWNLDMPPTGSQPESMLRVGIAKATTTIFFIALYNPDNLSAEAFNERENTYGARNVYEPYITIDGIKTTRVFRYMPGISESQFGMFIIFSKGSYVFQIISTVPVLENEEEFLEIAKTFVAGAARDYPAR